MINWITNWAEAIIIAVVIATIIEMILPEGNCKKYIKVVIGVYILFTIISPVITKFTGKTVSVSDLIDLSKYVDEVKEKEKSQNLLAQNNETNIKDMYISNLKTDIKSKLKRKGYTTQNINLDISNDENYTLNKIYLSVSKIDENEETDNTQTNEVSKIEIVNEVNVSISNEVTSTENKKEKDSLSTSDKKKIKEYLSSVYEIQEKKIVFE